MNKAEARLALKQYVIGFTGSIALTIVAFAIVTQQLLSGWQAGLVIIGLALLQFCLQLLYFLHVSAGSKPRWKLATFWFMLLIILIIVGGSLWIMHSLNYRMMPTEQQMLEYMQDQSGF